jgi:predicted nucleotide-binding protein
MDESLEALEEFKSICVTIATSGKHADFLHEYSSLRKRLVNDEQLKQFLPEFMKTCRRANEFWLWVKDADGSYAGRSRLLQTQFFASLDYLEQNKASSSQGKTQNPLAIEKLREHIRSIRAMAATGRVSDDELKRAILLGKSLVLNLVGSSSLKYKELEEDMKDSPFAFCFSDENDQEKRNTKLKTLITHLDVVNVTFEHKERVDMQTPTQPQVNNRQPQSTNESDKVFIVHGHDSDMLKSVKAFLADRGVPFGVLSNQPSAGQTLIEKFEKHARVSAAIVLMSPDDALADVLGSKQARPNVLFEIGYFFGSIGRGKTILLKHPEVIVPSDISGIGFITYDKHEKWQLELLTELKGIDVPFKI